MSEPAPHLSGEHVTLRLQRDTDVPDLLRIRATPEVIRWWGPPDDDLATRYVVEHEGRIIGAIQYAEEDTPEYRSAGIDIYLDPSVHRRGLGTDAVRTMARHLFVDRGHHRLTIDPAVENATAIACYRRVGFKPIGVARQYEQVRWEDGRYRDGLLMDLLVDDLIR